MPPNESLLYHETSLVTSSAVPVVEILNGMIVRDNEEVIDCLRKSGAHLLSQREGRKALTIYYLGAGQIGRADNNNNKKRRNEGNGRRYLQ